MKYAVPSFFIDFAASRITFALAAGSAITFRTFAQVAVSALFPLRRKLRVDMLTFSGLLYGSNR